MSNNLWSANRSDELLVLLQKARREAARNEDAVKTLNQAIDVLIGIDDWKRSHPDSVMPPNSPDGHLGATEAA
jgi:hypothetical protein